MINSTKLNWIFVAILALNILVLEFFEPNFLGLVALALIAFWGLYQIKVFQNPKEPEAVEESSKLSDFSRRALVILLPMLSVIIASFSLISIVLEGSPIKIWSWAGVLILLMAGLLVSEIIFKFRFLVLRFLFLIILLLSTYDYLNTDRALWPNKKGSIFGLSERPYNHIQAAGWDWGEEWFRFEASPEDFQKLIHHFNKYKDVKGASVLIKDSVAVIPNNNLLGFRKIDPYHQITSPCESWYTEFVGDSFAKDSRRIYYDEPSQTVILVQVTEL